MEIYDISIAPGQVRDIFVNGSYVYFYSGSAGGADATITVNQDSRGQRVLLMPGQAYRMPDGQVGTRWLIGNLRGEGTIVGRLVIGSGELTDNRVTGSVEVIDGGKNRTNAGMAFVFSSNMAGVAGVAGSAILWNPLGSGKNLFVKAFRISMGGAAPYGLEMVTGLGTGLTQDATYIAPKKIGSVSVAKGLRTTAGNFNGQSWSFNSISTATLAANVVDQVQYQEPVLIQPGQGMRAFVAANEVPFICNIEYIEEST